MCGISGQFYFSQNKQVNADLIKKSVSTLKLRGPDNSNYWVNKNVGLAHARLSIIDTSSEASQPFICKEGRYILVFNGEFFNYKEHKKNLESEGYTFRTTSDTEVLLQLLIKHRERAIPLINGFFGFAFYDKQENTLLLARDRYGIKPLYFSEDTESIKFGSELKALFPLGIRKEIDPVSLEQYFHLNYIPAPHSIYKGIKKVIPGTYIKADTNGMAIHTYYELKKELKNTDNNYTNVEKQLRSLLESSVELRLVSDVPLGCFLSGGIDSSVITGIAANKVDKLKTFSIGFADEPFFDETEFAELVSKKHRTDHTVFKLTNNDLFEHLHDVLNYIDEPFADSSALNVFILSKETRKKVTVSLSGDGADELFAGYNKHRAEFLSRKYKAMNGLFKGAQPFLSMAPKSRNNSLFNKFRQAEKYIKTSTLPFSERYYRMAGYTNRNDIKHLLNHHPQRELHERNSYLLRYLNEEDFNSVLLTDQVMVLEGDMLVKADRMSMANSLEIRVPFLDYRVVDYTNGLPSEFKIDSNRRKKILIDSCRDLLPQELFNRKKQGFEVPLLKWFQTELKSIITDDLLNESFIKEQGLFHYQEIARLKKQLFSSTPNDAVARIWALIVFQYWYKHKHLSLES